MFEKVIGYFEHFHTLFGKQLLLWRDFVIFLQRNGYIDLDASFFFVLYIRKKVHLFIMLVPMERELMDRIRERTDKMIKSIARRSEFETNDTDPVPVLYQLSSKD